MLPQPRSSSLEYAVHGKWRRSEDDANGMHGCWYVGVDETFGAQVVNAKLAAYEAAQAAARASAVVAAVAAAAARLAERAT